MRIAVVGSGISGNVAARILATLHNVDVYESSSHLGGHAQTVESSVYGRDVTADIGFMVFNRRTYPNFCRLLQILGVDSIASDMSLSVRCFNSGFEYQGSSLNGLFAQRRNLFRGSFYKMLLDIGRFNRRAISFCEGDDEQMLLGEFVAKLGVGRDFLQHYLVPMSAAIWSADPARLKSFPAKFILGFLRNHGLLQLKNRPQWLTIARRSQDYVQELMRPIRDRVNLNSSVQEVRRQGDQVLLRVDGQQPVFYDHVVMACHADQSLQILADANPTEQNILHGFPYQSNSAVLHTDESVLPRNQCARASWNYHIPEIASDRASVTYDLNRLQCLGLPGPLCLTLNPLF